VPESAAEASRRELGSRFLARVAPAATIEAAKAAVAALSARHPDATHVVFAWRVGWPAAERASDAGEPAGTAGPPVLRELRAAGLADVVAVVVRWYGGTKLGKGGLARAYAGVVRDALDGLASRERRPAIVLEVEAPHERVGALKRLVRPGRVELVEERYAERARLRFEVALEARAGFESALAELALAARAAASPIDAGGDGSDAPD
jgi:uncharacterized YigZ family protein